LIWGRQKKCTPKRAFSFEHRWQTHRPAECMSHWDGYTVRHLEADKTCSVLPLSPMYWTITHNSVFLVSVLVWCGMSLTRTQQCIRYSRTDFYYEFNCLQTLRQTKPRERPEAAICVRKSSARRVLHFTPLNAASCVLHRPANRVIHRLQL